MPKDPTIAIRDCLAEIELLHEIAERMTLQAFRSDPIVRRAAAYAIQTISEAVRQIPDEWLADFPIEPWGQIKGIGNNRQPYSSRILSYRRWHSVGDYHDRHACSEDSHGINADATWRLGFIATVVASSVGYSVVLWRRLASPRGFEPRYRRYERAKKPGQPRKS